MSDQSAAELVVACLEEAGITDAFGMAGHTNVALLDAMIDSKIRFHSVRHEQVAAHAADAYFRVNRRPAALISHIGPGLTNALTGLGDAVADCSAVVVVAGDVPSFHQGKDAFQELGLHTDAGQWEMARPLTKRAWRVTDTDSLRRKILNAVRIARTGRPGPVLLSVAMDVFSARVPATRRMPVAIDPVGMTGAATADAIHAASELLRTARRPVILAGGGALEARDAITALAEITGAPVITTLSGRTTVDEFHPQCLGPIGRTGSTGSNRAGAEADVLLAIGTQFPEQDSSSWVPGRTFRIPPTKLIHVDVDVNQIGKIYPAAVGIVADAREAASGILENLRAEILAGAAVDSAAVRDQWLAPLRTEHDAWRAKHVDAVLPGREAAIHPGYLLQQLSAAVPDNAIFLGDVGWGKNGTSQFIRRRAPRTMLVASGYGTMGWSAAAALGAKVANPRVPVVSITGDGGMSSCASALITAAEYGIAVVWIVLNNGVYQSIMGLQQQHFSRTLGTVFWEGRQNAPRTDFVALATGCHVEARGVSRPEELAEAIAWALSLNRPVLLDVLTDPTAFPPAAGFWDVHAIYDGQPQTTVTA